MKNGFGFSGGKMKINSSYKFVANFFSGSAKYFAVSSLVLMTSLTSFARPTKLYFELALSDIEVMTDTVRSIIEEARSSEAGKEATLQDGFLRILSRPDEDGMINKIIGPLRIEMEDQGAWPQVMIDVTGDAVRALQSASDESLSPEVLTTYQIYLENLVSFLKPYSKKLDSPERNMLKQIRDAKIVLPKAVRQERELRMMKVAYSPSILAERLVGKKEQDAELEKSLLASSDTVRTVVPVAPQSDVRKPILRPEPARGEVTTVGEQKNPLVAEPGKEMSITASANNKAPVAIVDSQEDQEVSNKSTAIVDDSAKGAPPSSEAAPAEKDAKAPATEVVKQYSVQDIRGEIPAEDTPVTSTPASAAALAPTDTVPADGLSQNPSDFSF